MESALNIILSTENVRTLAIIVSVICGVVWIKVSMKNLEHRTEASIKGLEHKMESSIMDLKLNDLASIHKRIDEVEISLGKRIDEVEISLNKRIDELKYNDFAHLSSDFANLRSDFANLMNAFVALTYVLEKNGTLSKEDREFVVGAGSARPLPALLLSPAL